MLEEEVTSDIEHSITYTQRVIKSLARDDQRHHQAVRILALLREMLAIVKEVSDANKNAAKMVESEDREGLLVLDKLVRDRTARIIELESEIEISTKEVFNGDLK